jgi:hypothetical protein
MTSSFREFEQSSARAEPALFAYEAPFLIEKLVAAGVARSEQQARQLVLELQKYFWLSRHSGAPLPMSSALVDAAWHQFVLFTREYAEFCRQHLGAFLHHGPTLADGPPAAQRSPEEFVQRYEAQFGPLPPVWRDAECLEPASLLRWPPASDVLKPALEGGRALLRRGDAAEVLCRASARALPALEFMAHHPRFLVRELPGLRTPEEQLSLVEPLVRHHVLCLAI